jgi:hypothetical protein
MQTGASASSNNNGAAEGGGYVPKYSNGPVKNNLNKKRPNPSQRALQSTLPHLRVRSVTPQPLVTLAARRDDLELL